MSHKISFDALYKSHVVIVNINKLDQETGFFDIIETIIVKNRSTFNYKKKEEYNFYGRLLSLELISVSIDRYGRQIAYFNDYNILNNDTL